jgi:hypothetical protein
MKISAIRSLAPVVAVLAIATQPASASEVLVSMYVAGSGATSGGSGFPDIVGAGFGLLIQDSPFVAKGAPCAGCSPYLSQGSNQSGTFTFDASNSPDFSTFVAALSDSKDYTMWTLFFQYTADGKAMGGGGGGIPKSYYGFPLNSADTIDAVRLTLTDFSFSYAATGYSYSYAGQWDVIGTQQSSPVPETNGSVMMSAGLATAAGLAWMRRRRGAGSQVAARSVA